MRVAVVAPKPTSGEKGGAERLFAGLVWGLNESGADAELVEVDSDESTYEKIQETYLRCYDLDLSGFDAVVSTKAPTYLIRHDRHACYLLHTMRSFYDMYEQVFPRPSREIELQRRLIIGLDTAALKPPRTRAVFSIGEEVAERLARHNGIASRVLHPSSNLACRPGPQGDYILVPGRLHRWKRVDLVIDALHLIRSDVRVKICGAGEDETFFRQQAKADRRIEFCGYVSDAQLIDLYSNALAIAFVSIREDFGYVALEAMMSAKPLITCKDSGEPARMIQDGVTGFICEPNDIEISKAIRTLHENPEESLAMGIRARQQAPDSNWRRTAEALLRALD